MTPEAVAVVQESFQTVASTAEQVAEIFDHHLCSLDPQLKSVFPLGTDRRRRIPGQLRSGEVYGVLLGPSARLQSVST
jgi:hypothetical protein